MLRPGDSSGARLSRRGWLAGLGGASTAWVVGCRPWAVTGSVLREQTDPAPGLIIRNRRPLDAETPVEAFDTWLTPTNRFFVRSHFGEPAIGLRPWRIEVTGLVERPLTLELDALGRYEVVERAAVLQCAGNGRAFFRPNIPGVGWERGAVGNARWAGVRLADLLQAAGLKPGAAHVHLHGADNPPNPKTPRFLRSLPLDRALNPTTLLATRMNGDPLPVRHGGPARLVVPGWTGNHWIKWIQAIHVSDVEAPGFYQQTGYRIPREPLPAGVQPKPEDLVPVTEQNVKSLVARPSRTGPVPAGRFEAVGVAWTGSGHVRTVEVRLDDGPWQAATLEGPAVEGSWRQWRIALELRPGAHHLAVRATDDAGRVQPEVSPWNKSGYLWNAIETVPFEVLG